MIKVNGGSHGTDMTTGKVFPIMIDFAVPLLLANLIQQLYNAADMMIVGKVIGSVGTVGVSTGGILITFLTGVGNAFGSAAQICTAHMWGAGKRDKIGELGSTVLYVTLLASLVIGAVCILLAQPFLKLLHCPEEALGQARNYMQIAAIGLPAVLGYNVVSGVMRGMGESKKPLFFVTVSAISNVFMDLLLVVVFPCEAAGSAIATVAAQVMAFLVSLLYIQNSQMKDIFNFKKNRFKIQTIYIMPVIKIAVPLALQFGCIHVSQIICNAWVNGWGMIAAATTSIGNKIGQFISVVTLSINGAAGAMVAQNLGAKKPERVKQTVYAALGLCALICAVEVFVSLVFPRQLFSLFTNDESVIELGKIYLSILLITFFLNSLQGPYTSVITGSGNAKLSFAYGALDGIVLRLGISYILAYVYGLGVIGYWIGNALAHLGPVIIGIIYFYCGSWAKRRLTSDEIKEGGK
ncbi:MAG: MATE family efflux transporter [Lachnospiraceae bacterium]|nr:MATE family efflux transporter [Lachnospiraceae bacterium]MDE6184785.1 MATE family efflux transporter [Lachnospiraceae bacterium]